MKATGSTIKTSRQAPASFTAYLLGTPTVQNLTQLGEGGLHRFGEHLCLVCNHFWESISFSKMNTYFQVCKLPAASCCLKIKKPGSTGAGRVLDHFFTLKWIRRLPRLVEAVCNFHMQLFMLFHSHIYAQTGAVLKKRRTPHSSAGKTVAS